MEYHASAREQRYFCYPLAEPSPVCSSDSESDVGVDADQRVSQKGRIKKQKRCDAWSHPVAVKVEIAAETMVDTDPSVVGRNASVHVDSGHAATKVVWLLTTAVMHHTRTSFKGIQGQ
jgi:hypothetical protein